MKDLDGNRLKNSDLCKLAGEYERIISTSGIEELTHETEYQTLIQLRNELQQTDNNQSEVESITLAMRLSASLKNIYKYVIAKEIEKNNPQWTSLANTFFEKNETSFLFA